MNVTNVTDYDNSYIYNINVKLYLGGNNMSCGNIFIMKTIIDKCPHCEMTYGVTPCSSRNKENVVAAGIRY